MCYSNISDTAPLPHNRIENVIEMMKEYGFDFSKFRTLMEYDCNFSFTITPLIEQSIDRVQKRAYDVSELWYCYFEVHGNVIPVDLSDVPRT